MKSDWLVKSLLLLAVIFLGIIALRPYLAPPVVRAQSEDVNPIPFGPSQVIALHPSAYEGNVVLDLRTGNVWQFPQFAPHMDASDKSLRVSHPLLVGRFALEDLNRK
jgi:hypothetical protein